MEFPLFLNRLNNNEKEAFLALAHHVAHVDKRLSSEEEDMIAKYCMEMQLDDIEFNLESFDLQKTLENFTTSSHQKIALLEILALMYADGSLASEEDEIIRIMIAQFDLNPNLAVVYREWSKSILSLFVQGEALIHL